MERKDVEARFKWKTQDIFTDDEHWEREFEAVENTYADYDFSAYENKFDDKQTLLDFFRVVQDFSRRAEKLYLYAHMCKDQDVRVSKYASYTSQIMSLFAKVSARTSFAEPQLTALADEIIDGYIADPDFAAYEYRLRRAKQSKAHVLSAQEEKLLENPVLFNAPIVRNGKEATVGYCPEVWAKWE